MRNLTAPAAAALMAALAASCLLAAVIAAALVPAPLGAPSGALAALGTFQALRAPVGRMAGRLLER